MAKIPFVGEAYTLRSVNYDCQNCINLYPVKSEVGTSKDVVGLQGTPGLWGFIDFDAVTIPNLFVAAYQDTGNSSYNVAVYDVDTNYSVVTFDNTVLQHSDGLPYVRLSRDGRYLAILSYPQDNTTQCLFLFDTTDWQEVDYGNIQTDNSPYYEQVAFSDTLIGFASDSGSIPDFLVYDLDTKTLQHSINDGTGGYGQSIAFSPDGSLMAVGSYSSTGAFANVRVLNTSDWSAVTIPTTAVGKSLVFDLKFSPDGSYLAAAIRGATDNNILHLWDTATWTHSSQVSNSNLAGVSGVTMNIDWSQDSTEILLAYVPAVVTQPVGSNPYVTWYMKVAVPSLTITYLYGSHVDVGGSRTYQDVTNPVSWAAGTDVFLTDATNNNLIAFDGTNTVVSVINLPGVISSMTKKGDI